MNFARFTIASSSFIQCLALGTNFDTFTRALITSAIPGLTDSDQASKASKYNCRTSAHSLETELSLDTIEGIRAAKAS